MAERILIVDDDPFICEFSGGILVEAGYEVSSAADGVEAWEMIERAPDRFDLFLLDKRMPRLDGLGLLKRLKHDARLRNIPAILQTGDDRQQDVTEGLGAGAYYYLVKPAPEAVLKQVVRNALNDFRERRVLRARIGRHSTGLALLQRAEFLVCSLEEARDLAVLLADASPDPARTVDGYSELLFNAVEHGNLELMYADKTRLKGDGRWEQEVQRRLHLAPYANRRVSVAVERSSAAYHVTIRDEGRGFDWQKYLDYAPERAFDLNGRGIAIAKATCFDEMRYLGSGNTVLTSVFATRAREGGAP